MTILSRLPFTKKKSPTDLRPIKYNIQEGISSHYPKWGKLLQKMKQTNKKNQFFTMPVFQQVCLTDILKCAHLKVYSLLLSP